MKSVYLAYTPYHILLSSVIATASDTNKEKALLIFKDFVNPEVFASVLRKWKLNPFDEILLMNGVYDAQQYNRRFEKLIKPDSSFNIIRRNVDNVKRYIKKNNIINKVFTFHDGRAESQIAEYINHKKGGTNIYVEDGAAVYNDHIFPKPSPFVDLFHKIYFGRWFQFIRFHGDYEYTHKIMALRPDLVRPDLRFKKIERIPVEALSILRIDKFIFNILKEYGSPKISKPDILIVLPHSEFLLGNNIYEQYITIMRSILDLAHDRHIYFKYHPREKVPYFNDMVTNKDMHVIEIPQGLPMEVMYLHILHTPPKVIVGDISTSLVLAGILYGKRSTIISILRLLGLKKYPYLEKVFERLGVLVPDTVNELKEIMKSNLRDSIEGKEIPLYSCTL
jgi:hypothetical protein